ncbi:MAG TPA: S-layer homology domain-containing protein [Thermoanaerobacterales bacterium]|nr:S-layer homology domain-containing protein [Thermoanaerobacterales bacterium]
MKKGILSTITILCLVMIFPGLVSAQHGIDFYSPGFEGGIANENEYSEMVFITGRAILLEGTCTIKPGRMRGDVLTTNYTYKLENTEEDIKLDRRVTIETTFSKDDLQDQVIAVSKITSAKENIRAGKNRYTLKDYQFSQSTIADENAGISYYAGSWDGRKTYDFNRNKGEIVVSVIGEIVGQNHNWGGAETQKVGYFLDFNGEIETGRREWERSDWTASVETTTSVYKTKELTYVPNEPAWISFRGGYLQTEQTESIMKYEYNLPRFDTLGLPTRGRRTGEGTKKLVTVPINQRLPIPDIKDINGHWAQEDIERLLSLKIFNPDGSSFGPSVNMSRGEFAYAIAKTCEMLEEDKTPNNLEEPLFKDVPKGHKYFDYIQQVGKKGVISGTELGYFSPNRPLTRGQALTIIIRALGLEGLAPNPPFNTRFADDDKIPLWAKPAIFAAREIGLVTGDSFGRVLPDQIMTKAEAAAFLNRFITFLQHDIKQEYIDRILNY